MVNSLAMPSSSEATETSAGEQQKAPYGVTIQDLDIVIEYPKGSFKQDTDNFLSPSAGWYMYCDYGYIPGTVSNEEGDELDVFLGPDQESDVVFLITLLDEQGDFNEVKTFVGFSDEEDAKKVMEYQYGDCRMGNVLVSTIADFKQMCADQLLQYQKQKALTADPSREKGEGPKTNDCAAPDIDDTDQGPDEKPVKLVMLDLKAGTVEVKIPAVES
jgi:hypothetical protein